MKIKFFFSFIINKISIFLIFIRLFLILKIIRHSNYQSDYFFKSSNRYSRQCKNRLDAIKQHLFETHNILDIGCNEGYFLFNLIDKSGFGIGIDEDRNSILIAQSISKLKNKNNINYFNLKLNEKIVKKLPTFDTIIFMSVFHHMVYRYGEESAVNILKILCKKTNRYLVFETGHVGEVNLKWSNSMKFMNNDYDKWIINFFLDNGFKTVKSLGEFSTNVSDVKRKIFFISKLNS